MHDTIKTFQAELRSLLQRPKTTEGWDALVRQLERVYLYPTSLAGAKQPDFSPDAVAQIKEEVLPAVEQELDRSWPALLRVVRMDQDAGLKRFGKILHVSFYRDDMIRFGARHGKKYNRAISGKLLREMVPLWMDQGSYEGFILGNVHQQHEALLAALLDANPAPLRHLRWTSLTSPGKERGSTLPDGPRAASALMVERCGQTLESFGAEIGSIYDAGRGELELAMYGPLLERPAELPALRQLAFGYHAGDKRDLCVDLLCHEGFDGLDTLRFSNQLSAPRARALLERPASLNLRRIGIGYIRAEEGDALRALIAAPNLANVQSWNLRERGTDEGWETEEVAIWRAQKRGQDHTHTLDQATVDLHKLDEAMTADALLKDGALRPSERLRALRIKHIDAATLDTLITQACAAWPNLECLVLMGKISEEATYVALERSGLLQQLKYLWWSEYDDPYILQLRALQSDKKAQQAARLALVARALDEATHPVFAHRMGSAAFDISMLRLAKEREAVGKALGLTASAMAGNDQFRHLMLFRMELRNRRGGDVAALRDGPQGLMHDSNAFVWP
jgi:hypothetical protein